MHLTLLQQGPKEALQLSLHLYQCVTNRVKGSFGSSIGQELLICDSGVSILTLLPNLINFDLDGRIYRNIFTICYNILGE